MATLLEDSLDYRSPDRGEIVEGAVMGWDRDGVLIDVGGKSEGVVPRHEMQSLGSDAERRLEAGDRVLVFVLQPESPEGQMVLSIDRARGERGWRVLQERFESGESFEAVVTGYNKGGLLVNVEGVNGFVPLSQVVGVRPDRGRDDPASGLAEAVGRTLRLKVIEINRRRNRVILSERAALQEWRLQQKERLIQELHEGDIRRGRISSVRSFGVFVDLGGADGLAHLSELSWERDKSPAELCKVGDEVDVYVTKVDPENKKIALSLRRANPGKWEAVVEKYREGQVVTGVVTKLVPFGAFARIDGPIEGLIHVSELVDRRIAHPREVVREGDLLPLKIVRIERDRHRLGLSLRRAREEGEAMGFVFSDGAEVISVPEDLRAEFEAREGPLPRPPAPPREAEAEPALAEPEREPEAAELALAAVPAAGREVVTEEEAPATAAPEPELEAAEASIAEAPPAAPEQVEEAPLPAPAEAEPAEAEPETEAEAAELALAAVPAAGREVVTEEEAPATAAPEPELEAAEASIAEAPPAAPEQVEEEAVPATAEAEPAEAGAAGEPVGEAASAEENPAASDAAETSALAETPAPAENQEEALPLS